MRVLTTAYCTLDFDPVRSIVRYTRGPSAYAAIGDIYEEAARIRGVLSPLGSGLRVFVDLRAVVPRNDPAFEKAIASLRKAIFAGCSRAAIVVRTAVGVLQTQRHVREDKVDAHVFEDERAALAHVMGHGALDDAASASRR